MHIFSVLPPRLGGLDMLLPIFYEIKKVRPTTKIALLFYEDRVFSDLSRDPFLSKEVFNIADSVRRFRVPTKKKVRLIDVFPKMAASMIDILRSDNPLLLHSRGGESYMIKMLNAMIQLRGGKTYQHFGGSILTIDRTRVPLADEAIFGDGFICFSEHDFRFFQNMEHINLHPIGYPRLYPNWINRVKKVSIGLLNEEFSRYGLSKHEPPLVLFLGSVVKELFSKEELKQWVVDVLDVAKKMMPETPVLLKPHPVEKQHVLEMIESIVRHYKKAWITYLHPCILASQAQMVIAHHSSTIIDSMGMGAPTIQYQELTPHWLNRHPEGSSFLKLGPLWARNRIELEAACLKVLSGHHTLPDVRIPLKHNMDLSVFLKESS